MLLLLMADVNDPNDSADDVLNGDDVNR